MNGTDGTDGHELPRDPLPGYSTSTQAIHADDFLSTATDVAPPIHVSTTFHYENDPLKLMPISDNELFTNEDQAKAPYVYSRLTAPNMSRLEAVLSSLCKGRVLSYSSGLAAFHALLVYFNPKVIAIGDGYHGCHGLVKIQQKLTGIKKVDLFDEATWDAAGLGKGDIVHIETPLNPTGEAYDIAAFAEKAHKRGAYLTVDATFGPPGLQDPFAQGADMIMHSGSKYFGGHSDMLMGALVMQNSSWWREMSTERLLLGSVVGNLEGWLGLRSLRTLELRVQRQSANATALVQWLADAVAGKDVPGAKAAQSKVLKVQHASLQKDDMHWLGKQMPNGYGPVFALWMRESKDAKALPSKLRLFHHATSLGGVESLIEWRRMSDQGVDERLLRVSVGVENWEDLRSDFVSAFDSL